MGNHSTVFVVNGSSLGGGEVDAIIRASLMRGVISTLDGLAAPVAEFARRMDVDVIEKNALSAYIRGRNVTVVLNGFLRDLMFAPLLLRWKLAEGRRLKVVLAVHSDPMGGLRPPTYRVRATLLLYELVGRAIANRVRFMSERQLRTFPLLARSKAAYIDAPTSWITRAHSGLGAVLPESEHSTDFLFIGRLSSSRFLGDAKNSDFVKEFSDYVELRGGCLTVIAGGNRMDVLDRLRRNNRTRLVPPTPDVTRSIVGAKALLIPSVHEGYCLMAREAALLGCRVLTTPAVAPELQTLPNVTVLDGFDPADWYAAAQAGTA